MAYRTADDQLRATVVHGPFPLRWGRLGAAMVAAVLGLLITAIASLTRVMTCDRAADRCVITTHGLIGRRPIKLRLSELSHVTFEVRKQHKGSDKGYPILQLGDRRRTLRPTSPAKAERFAAEVNRALETKQERFEVRIVGERWWFFFAAALWLITVALGTSAMSGAGRVVLELDRERRRVVARHKLFGVKVREELAPLDRVGDVQLEWRRFESFWDHKHHPGVTEARLVLVGADGERRPITERFRRGYTLHLEAERALRELLELEDRDPELQESLEKTALAFHPPPSMTSWPAGAWLGMCCGALAGITLLGIAGLVLGAWRLEDDLQSWMVAVGGGGGAVGGALLGGYLTRKRPPR